MVAGYPVVFYLRIIHVLYLLSLQASQIAAAVLGLNKGDVMSTVQQLMAMALSKLG